MTISPFKIFTQQERRYCCGFLPFFSKTAFSLFVNGSRFSPPLTISTAQVPQEHFKHPELRITPAMSLALRMYSPASISACLFSGNTVIFARIQFWFVIKNFQPVTLLVLILRLATSQSLKAPFPLPNLARCESS